MEIDRRSLIGVAATLPLATMATAQQAAPPPVVWPPAEHFPLWPNTPPGAPSRLPTPSSERNGYQGAELWLRGIDRPYVAVYRPKKPDGRAVLSIPGGGYGFLSVSNEGIDVAAALNPQGITVFVLAYRLPREGWRNHADVPLQDAQRAMRLIRANAAKYRIDPARLGLLGFSAGGHLGAMLAVGHADRVYAPVDAADTQPARPAYAGLVYPVVSFATAGLNSRSSGMLLGDNRDPGLLARYTPLNRITADTPPIWLLHAMDDATVPVAQSLAMVEACQRVRVPVEAHLLERGGHGFGALHLPAQAPGRSWPEILGRWTATR
ncbi:alpha/beta hydrolase [Sphingomonas xinjiangensis]|uniref:Acetyl esterase/lipase n=1 Tax=Sphingomonas xinjiangensis TaxID=643568 RepID=A0A840YMQ2_9SPHN|nr:alpha/beta hydrolase [Sphingomonas xinjiangensis]MBB5708861.1 acetyl esterase/lipase [Sphingomonas xinjiangensis]